MTSKNRRISERILRFEVLHVLFCLRAEVFNGGLGISKFQFLILKYIFFSCKFLPVLGHQTMDLEVDPH